MSEKHDEVARKMNNFSVGLGLFDYINPILYGVTTYTLARNMVGVMGRPVFVLFAVGAVLSLLFGLAIPTVKFLVGLGLLQFKMPVPLVFCVNSGIFLSGLALFITILRPAPVLLLCVIAAALALLLLIYKKTRKFNTVAVLTGAVGYLLIYSSMITLSVCGGFIVPVLLYALAICLFLGLCLIGIRANLKDARVHWVIEISNVLCQLSVALATVLAFPG